TPTAAGSYTVTAAATGFTSLVSDPVTVTEPTLGINRTPFFFARTIGAGLHRNYIVTFSDPVPASGLTVHFSSSDPSKLTVPASITVLAGATSAEFRVSGVAPTTPPVVITASATGWADGTVDMDVVTPSFTFITNFGLGMPTTRTTLSAPHTLSVATTSGDSGFCDLANPAVTVQLTVTGSPANIVTITPASVTIPQDELRSGDTTVGTPTAAGSYTVTASASGFTSLVSDPVTVPEPTLGINRTPFFFARTIGAGLHRNYIVTFSDPVPASGLTVHFASSDTS